MLEFLVIFSLAALGSLVALCTDLALRIVTRRAGAETLTMGAGRGESASPVLDPDPVVTVGFALACYGLIALALISVWAGPLALERTVLAFALMCVGGLIGEISTTGTTEQLPSLDPDPESPIARRPISPGLSVALTIVLNLTFAVLSYGQGLIHLLPDPPGSAASAAAAGPDVIPQSASRTGVPRRP